MSSLKEVFTWATERHLGKVGSWFVGTTHTGQVLWRTLEQFPPKWMDLWVTQGMLLPMGMWKLQRGQFCNQRSCGHVRKKKLMTNRAEWGIALGHRFYVSPFLSANMWVLVPGNWLVGARVVLPNIWWTFRKKFAGQPVSSLLHGHPHTCTQLAAHLLSCGKFPISGAWC